eukprot:GHVP01020869.1.p1 GENE.GHVP01020869.1~~GHVP01020869.1.p1  ORF type:complete len:136 (+),score=26.11 GHVP01020869.1:600-1007(+)
MFDETSLYIQAPEDLEDGRKNLIIWLCNCELHKNQLKNCGGDFSELNRSAFVCDSDNSDNSEKIQCTKVSIACSEEEDVAKNLKEILDCVRAAGTSSESSSGEVSEDVKTKRKSSENHSIPWKKKKRENVFTFDF